MGDEKAVCWTLKHGSALEPLGMLGMSWRLEPGGRDADLRGLYWAFLLAFLWLVGLVALLVLVCCQGRNLNAWVHGLEDLVGISEAYLRSRALERGVPELLLHKRKLQPVEVAEQEQEDGPEPNAGATGPDTAADIAAAP